MIGSLVLLGCAGRAPSGAPDIVTSASHATTSPSTGSAPSGTSGAAAGKADVGAVMPSGAAGVAGVAGAASKTGMVVAGSPGYLHTQGAKLVDADGNEVTLTGINWFGMETTNYAPHGLWMRSLDALLDQIAALGYNMIRLPFCSQLFDPGSKPNGIEANAALNGLSGLGIMDKVVAGAKKRGLKVILDRHRPDANAQSALWYTDKYSEQRWIDDWKMLAAHYQGNSTVIGFDLHNEPHNPATWGDDKMDTDWRLAAERAGNAVLAVNPDLLIVVEGIQNYGSSGYWWGGNLRAAADFPVRLEVAERLVYSPHDYPSSVNPQTWFDDPAYPDNLPKLWSDTWGYLAEQDIAPIWIGEFGTKDQTSSDQEWLSTLTGYVQQHQLSFAYWCLNPNSGDTGGILQDDWKTVNQSKQAALQPLLAPLIP